MRRVAVTGLGAVTPLGNDARSTWRTAIAGVSGILEQEEVRRERGPDRVSPNFLPNVLVDSASGQLAISLGIKGPNYAVVSACATGSHAIGEAGELVRRGDADAVIP